MNELKIATLADIDEFEKVPLDERLSFFNTYDIAEIMSYEVTSPITKKQYRENVCGKGIKQEPFFHVFIDNEGAVDYVFPLISSGNFEVDQYCESFISKQTFRPLRIFGKPFSSSAVLPVSIIFR